MPKAKRIVAKRKSTSRTNFRKKKPLFKTPLFLVFVALFAVVGGYALFRTFAYSPTTEKVANGTTPNGYHTACIDNTGGTPGRVFMHVNSCTQPEKADGWTNSSTAVWCADTTGSLNPVENNWINDGICGGGGGGSSSGGGSASVSISANPNILTGGLNYDSTITYSISGSYPSYCERAMASNSPLVDPKWTGHVALYSGQYTVNPQGFGLYIYGIRCFDSSGNNIGHNVTTVQTFTPPKVYVLGPSSAAPGKIITISWTSTKATNCIARPPPSGWTGALPLNGSKQFKQPSYGSGNPVIYTVDCYYLAGGVKIYGYGQAWVWVP